MFIDRLPGPGDIYPSFTATRCRPTENVPPPFAVKKNKVTYIVTPLFNYELYGLVVSQHRSDSLLDISHRRWQDYLNIKDLCVVWGRNITQRRLPQDEILEPRFHLHVRLSRRRRRPCCFRAAPVEQPHPLRRRKLSRRVLDARPGDQIYFKGYLVSYSQPANQFTRGTSTVRDDTGNGACETVFVTDFRSCSAPTRWRAVNPLAFVASAVFFIMLGVWLTVAFVISRQRVQGQTREIMGVRSLFPAGAYSPVRDAKNGWQGMSFARNFRFFTRASSRPRDDFEKLVQENFSRSPLKQDLALFDGGAYFLQKAGKGYRLFCLFFYGGTNYWADMASPDSLHFSCAAFESSSAWRSGAQGRRRRWPGRSAACMKKFPRSSCKRRPRCWD